MNSRIIIPLGEHPIRILIDENFNKFGDVVGRFFEKVLNNQKIYVIPIYHPSLINSKGYKNNIAIFKIIKEKVIENVRQS